MLLAYAGALVFIILLLIIALRSGQIKWLIRLSYVLFIVFLVEIASVGIYYYVTGTWMFNLAYNYNVELFDPHPSLIGVPKKNIKKTFEGLDFTHNSMGFRGVEVTREKSKTRIVAIGGSTTYGVGVSDHKTWPYLLDSIIGEGYEVLNFGIPGHSTAEHIILSGLIVPDYKPDIVLIHSGLNDIRNMNVPNPAPDYSQFHAPGLRTGLGLCYIDRFPRIALIRLIAIGLKKLELYSPSPCTFNLEENPESPSAELDQYALYLYKRNLETLVDLHQGRGAEVILIPQLMTKEATERGYLSWWIPYVEKSKILPFLNEYNAQMADVAKDRNLRYVDELLDSTWTVHDFADPSHLNSEGNLRLAKIVSRYITTDDTTDSASTPAGSSELP